MKANYTPPKGVTQLTYNVSLKEITRLKALDERSKVIDEYPFQAIVRVKCSKQSDSNYKNGLCLQINIQQISTIKEFMYIWRLKTQLEFLTKILEFATKFQHLL